MIDILVEAGYWIGGGLVILSVVGYVVLPKLIKIVFNDTEQDDTDPPEANY